LGNKIPEGGKRLIEWQRGGGEFGVGWLGRKKRVIFGSEGIKASRLEL